jgi:sRNA-binding regulator protein Hfq
MGNLFESRTGAGFDTSQPGIRTLQGWVKSSNPVSVQLVDGTKLEGQLCWVDADFVGVMPAYEKQPILVSRTALAVIRVLV